jgi:hypothetical protein
MEKRRLMRKLVMVMLGSALFAAVLSGTGFAQQYPNVSNLTPFSAQANFMSLPGYLRYVVNQQSG